MLTRFGVLLALTCCLLAGLATPARAASTTFRLDRTAGPPENDMRVVRVVNGQKFLKATFTLRDLRKSARSKVELVYTPRGADYPYVVQLRQNAKGQKQRHLLLSDGFHDVTSKLPCAGLKGTWKYRSNQITMRVPQRCFPQNAKVARVKAMAGFFTYTGAGDYTSFRRLKRG